MIQLCSMTEEAYQKWLAISVADYAKQKADAGFFKPEEALQKSKDEFARILPQGLATPDQYLYSITTEEPSEVVGMIWFASLRGQTGPLAYIYDLMIYPAYRRHGYGEAAMRLLEEKVRELGLNTIELNVFGHNLSARALYEKVGYNTAAITMTKKLF
ncbi:MAG: GNAT family N-acetyltransferase [Anaerolineaceae bacterium]